MDKQVKKYLYMLGAALLALGVVLYFFHPLAPVLLLGSALIQAPVVWLLVTSSYKNSYKNRSFDRVKQFEKDGDARKWLEEEQKELNSIGRKYWSRSGDSLSALNRAQANAALQNFDEAERLFAEIQEKRLPSFDHPRYLRLKQTLEEHI